MTYFWVFPPPLIYALDFVCKKLPTKKGCLWSKLRMHPLATYFSEKVELNSFAQDIISAFCRAFISKSV